MSEFATSVYSFSGFRIDLDERLLFRGDESLSLPPKVFDTLQMLVKNPGRILSKEKMLAEIWDDSFVEENNLAQNISQLRKLLGDSAETKFIETVPKFGYRFVADVTAESTDIEITETTHARIYIDDGEEHLPVRAPVAYISGTAPETRYVQNGDVNIAYQVVGEGDIDIVFVMGWVSHLEYFWKEPRFARFLMRLASFSRLILFDKRGTGLSDHVPLSELPTLEQRMEDVHAVMDAVDSKRAVLVGISEGGPMCALFAATYPERTAGLVMIGTYARRTRDDDYPWAPTPEERAKFIELVKTDWAKGVGLDERAPSLKGDKDFREWWATYLRMGASPGAAVVLTTMNAEIDVRPVLPLIRVPTLVIHRTGDLALKVEEGRYVASKIPDSRYVELPGDDHLPFVGDQDQILDEIEQFVTGVKFAGEYDRVLTTVMNVAFADPEGERAKRADDKWSRFVAASRDFVQRQFRIFKGREVSIGDSEMLAAFDGPARAIRCAIAINQAAQKHKVRLEIGIHTGECDVQGNVYSGFAVDLARRVRATSTDGNIIVSRTVKDLVAGSGLEFKEVGLRSFEGIDGEWRLFSVEG